MVCGPYPFADETLKIPSVGPTGVLNPRSPA